MKIELFIFDMGDVLIFNGENIPEIARYLNIEPEILQRDYDKYDYPLMEGYMDTLDFTYTTHFTYTLIYYLKSTLPTLTPPFFLLWRE